MEQAEQNPADAHIFTVSQAVENLITPLPIFNVHDLLRLCFSMAAKNGAFGLNFGEVGYWGLGDVGGVAAAPGLEGGGVAPESSLSSSQL